MPEQIEYEWPEPEKLIPLAHPISFKGAKVDSIRLTEPNGAQVRKAEGRFRAGVNPESLRLYQLDLIEASADLSREVVDQLPVSAIVQASDYLAGFITPTRRTGSS